MSAVSKKLMPASRAALTTRSDAAASMRIPKLLQPRPTRETLNDPIERCSMGLNDTYQCPTSKPPTPNAQLAFWRLGVGSWELTRCPPADLTRSEIELTRHLHEPGRHERVRPQPRGTVGPVVGQRDARVRHVVDVQPDRGASRPREP